MLDMNGDVEDLDVKQNIKALTALNPACQICI